MTAPTLARGRAGFSLVELLIAMVVMGLVMGSAVAAFRSQSRAFRKGGATMDVNQNARFAMSTMGRVVRTLGAGVAANQPMLVYAGADVITFNANYASDVNDGNSVYTNPDLPAGAVTSLLNSQQVTIPNTALLYPDSNYFWGAGTPSRAETISFYLRPDSSTADPTDFVLLQRVNQMLPELVARNIRAYPGRPFFEYWYDSTTATGQVFSRRLAAARLPVRHSVAWHGSPTDVGTSALADSVRMLRVNLVVHNGLPAPDSGSRAFSTAIAMPNNGLQQLKTCGDAPVLSGPLTATSPSGGFADLSWLPSQDETTGEQDVSGYNVYYRLASQSQWTTWTAVAAGQPGYTTSGGGFMPDSAYLFGVAAQDCSPQESTLITAAVTIAP